ncbi:glycoside hydrolase family 127 protein [Amnibacterium sp. CER49]|uniref:glycoside hydrolase family 127 protein n=1 Tax=Amnibacterium sp. CER49 TaxID=3039161 RepID=UPI00244BFF44|nr:beta-L-arabinofuranosidase domain-containing protein [Amnibacterium sp. CER49]MDH2443798.1 glycoside hydrolase family 127 protein [Amnibacterium sp. CER49]
MSTVQDLRHPTALSTDADVVLRPLDVKDAEITGGFWLDRQAVNRDSSIPDGLRRLHESGVIDNFRTVATGSGEARGPIFADSDVYKWLEAAAWEYGRQPDERLLAEQLEITRIVAAAQEPDGYLDTVVQLRRGVRYSDPAHDHELYCAGHLFQAAVAQRRATGRTELLDVAMRLADHLVREFGPGGRPHVEGHPVVEMGLVELYRETGRDDYLQLASRFVEERGHGLLHEQDPSLDLTYFSDRVPVRETRSPEGHAVRAVYLAAGAADVAAETRDRDLVDALAEQYTGMTTAKQYVTGGLGARWEGEAFGDPYELPPDRAYAETCAAIGAAQWAWRMLLSTGEARYADQIERMLLNAMLPGVSLGGQEFFYVNTLHLRADASPDTERSAANGRRPWFDVACCPPNVMRTVASIAGYVATGSDDGLQLHQYATGRFAGRGLSIEVQTGYPFDGTVDIAVHEAREGATLALRVPEWAAGATLDGRSIEPGAYALVDRPLHPGDRVALQLPMRARLTEADDRVDAVRGAVAIERGPLVYALEQVDQPEGVVLDDLRLKGPLEMAEVPGPGLVEGDIALRFEAVQIGRGGAPDRGVTATAVPYFEWANRGVGPMRVWMPRV